MLRFILTSLIVVSVGTAIAQSVGINATGNPPHASAILDLESTDKGMLVPRMNSSDRMNISPLTAGLLVYDTDEAEFWYYDGTAWKSTAQGSVDEIADTDNDTKIQVEEGNDEDVIRFDVGGIERMNLQDNANGQGLLQLNLGNSNLSVGQSAGLFLNTGGYNSFFGQMAGSATNTGHSNAFIGYEAGTANDAGHSNVFIGRAAGSDNEDGNNNLFIGRGAGLNNVSGSGNVFLSRNAGINNNSGSNNIAIGFGAGESNSTGSGNVFLGHEAGANETASNRLYVENSNSSSPLLYGEFDTDLLRVNGTLNVNNAYSLPTNDGSAGQVLTTDGAGAATWGTSTSSTMGGSAILCHTRDDAAMAAQGYCFAGEFRPDLSSRWVYIDSVGTNVPSNRQAHRALWTGKKMMIWGGQSGSTYYADGGLYDPLTDSWAAISTSNAPSARYEFSIVLADDKVIVWGGATNTTTVLGDGKIYDLATDTWSTISSVNAPSARRGHTAIWTGSEMIVFGGFLNSSTAYQDGAKYDPATDTWTPITTTSAPDGRGGHSAVWTGTEMIVWGGEGPLSLGEPFPNGGIYTPATNSWSSMANVPASQGRSMHDAYWIGDKMLIWEGVDQDYYFQPTGQIYDPVANSWSNIFGNSLYDEVKFESVWTGKRLLVHGTTHFGDEEFEAYDPATNTWDTSLPGLHPAARSSHTMVWADGKMILWGGNNGVNLNSGAVFYDTHLYIYLQF